MFLQVFAYLLLFARHGEFVSAEHSCSSRRNFYQLSTLEYFSLQDGYLSNVFNGSRTILYENVTSFAFYREKGRIYFTNSSGLYSFRERIFGGDGFLILGLAGDTLMFTKQNQICSLNIREKDNCMTFVLLGIFVSSVVTFITTATLPLLLNNQTAHLRRTISGRLSKRYEQERPLLRTQVYSPSCSNVSHQ